MSSSETQLDCIGTNSLNNLITCISCRHAVDGKEKCIGLSPNSKPDLADEVRLAKCTACDKCAGLYTGGKFRSIPDALYNSEMGDDGWRKVDGDEDRKALFLLSQVIYNEDEGPEESLLEVPFAMPPPTDFTKLLWMSRRAVGFYSMKPKGTICFETMQCYSMTTLDTIFIRGSHRRRGLATSALQDILTQFPRQNIGLSYPISIPMRKVLRKQLEGRPQDRPCFWEITGCPGQGNCRNLWLVLQKTGESS